MTFWDEISAEIKSNLSKKDLNALDDNVRELFNRFNEVPANDAWNLAKKVYDEHKHDYMINMAFSIGIPNNFDILPNKDEAWNLFEQIPVNVDPILKNDTKFWLISQLQYRADIIPANKVWNFLVEYSNDPDPKIRGEAGFTICEYIAESDKFPKKDAWDLIKILIKDSEKNVKERILTAFSYFYSDLPKDEVWALTLNLSKLQSKKIRDSCLNVAIEKSKDQIKLKDYLNASITLEQILKELRSCSRIGWIRFVFVGVLFIIGIYLVKDTWLYVFNNMPYLLLGIIILMVLIWKGLKLKAEKYMILFYFTIFTLPILLLFPLPYVILNFIFPISPKIYNIIIFGLIPSFIIPLMIFGHVGVSIKVISKNMRYILGEGLYNYYIGRYYVQNYIESKDSKIKLNFLKKAIKKFNNATESYNKLLFGFEKELSLCPYCLNFYKGINIYEDLLRKPKESSVKDLEKKINNSISIMGETNKGSDRLNQLLKELLNITKLLVELQKKRQSIPDSDSMDRMRIDAEIKEKSNDIDKIIEKIDSIISDIEDQNLPLIIEIMKEKRAELDNISGNIKKEGFKGLDKYYSREENNLMGILLFIIGIAMIFIGGLYSTTYLLIGVFLSVFGSIVMSLAKLKKRI